jgi:NitT/TauT family transport system substrate-binding protein
MSHSLNARDLPAKQRYGKWRCDGTSPGAPFLVALLALLAVACAPQAPSGPAAPAKPTEAPAAKPVEKTAPAAPAKPTEAPAAKPLPTAVPAKAEAKPAETKPAEAKPASSPAPKAEAKPAAKGKPELSTVKIAELHVAAKVPTFLADKLGYFKEEGIEIQIEMEAVGTNALPVLISGRIDIGHGGWGSVITAVGEGADFVMLTSTDSATRKAPDPLGMLVRTDSPFQRVEDLAGKRIAVTTLNSPSWLYAYATLKKHGVDPKGVRFVEIPLPNQNDALVQDRVDAINNIEPFHTVLVKSGKGRAIAYPFIEIHPGIDLGGWTVTRQWLNRNPETARAFVRAYNRGKEYALTHDKETRDAVIEWTKVEPDLARSMMLSNWTTEVDVASLQGLADMMLENGLIKQKFDVRPLLHETYLNPPK